MNNKLKEAISKLTYINDGFYVIDLEILSNELKLFSKAFESIKPIISYSYKTNYLKPIVNYLDRCNVRSEVVSPFEVEITKKYLIDPSLIIYNGPLKDKESILYVLSGGGIVHADSIEDLENIVYLVEDFNLPSKKVKIGVRFSFNEKEFNSRFGIEYSKANFASILRILNKVNIPFPYSIHFHYPSRDFVSFKNRADKIISFLNQINNLYGTIPKYIDIGGGFPSKMPDSVLSSINSNSEYRLIEEYGRYFSKLVNNSSLPEFKTILEPGTALVANAMHLVGHIRSVNLKTNNNYLNTDLSRNLLGGLNSKIDYPIQYISKSKKRNKSLLKKENYVVCGYSCVEGDILGGIDLNLLPEVNDKIILSSIGSYSNVFKSPFIRPDIAVYSWDGINFDCVRRKQDVSDIVNLDLI